MMSDLNMSHDRMSDVVSFPLFGFTLVIKLRNFDFESYWNSLVFFDKKKYNKKKMSDLIVSCQAVSNLV